MRKSDKLKNIKKVNMLTEQRQNSNRSIVSEDWKDMFKSKKTIEGNKQQEIINAAIEEVKNYNFMRFVFQPGVSQTTKEIQPIVSKRLLANASELPNLSKVMPELFNADNGLSSIIVNIGGTNSKCIITPELSLYLQDKDNHGMIADNNVIVNRIIEKLNTLNH